MYYSPQDVQKLIEKAMPDAKVHVSGDGSKFEATVISATFEGLNTMKRHQKIYAIMGEYITSGAIHALSLKTTTPDE